MKAIVIAFVLFWAADEVTDRAAIESAIRAFAMTPGRGSLYTSDFDRNELLRSGTVPPAEGGPIPITKEGVHGTVVVPAEQMRAAIEVKKIRFVTADVALVDVERYGPVMVVMKRVGAEWKIASVRRVTE